MNGTIKLTKSEAAYIELRKIILDFSLVPGQSICVKQMSDHLGFSATPLREALFALEKDGYVLRKKNDAFYVVNMSEDYIKCLFEYGKTLRNNALFQCRVREEIGLAGTLLRDDDGLGDIDALYAYAQFVTLNTFISGELRTFRHKAASVRNALRVSDNSLYRSIYSMAHVEIVPELCGDNSFSKVHLKKMRSADMIASSVLAYAMSRAHLIDKTRENLLLGAS